MRVLLVEDDAMMAQRMAFVLQSQSHVCDITHLGEDAVRLAKIYDYDIVVLDLMLPDISGHVVLRRLRQAELRTPVLILSELSGTDHKIKSLDRGADDYLTKPVDPREFAARLQTIVRRSRGHSRAVIQTGKLKLNLDTAIVEVNGQVLHVTPREYKLLELLSLRKGYTVSRDTLLDHVYANMDAPQPKIIDVFVCKLRQKLATATAGETYIETVWGYGYRLRDPEPTPGSATQRADVQPDKEVSEIA